MWQELKTPGAKCQKHAYLCKNKLLSDGGTVNIIQQLHKADNIQLEPLGLGHKRRTLFVFYKQHEAFLVCLMQVDADGEAVRC